MQRVVLSFLIAFILLLVVIALNQVTYSNAKKENHWTEYSRSVIKLYDNLAIQLRSAEIYSAAYKNSAAAQLYAIYKTDIDDLAGNLRALKDSVSNNNEQAKIVDSISRLLEKHMPVLRKKNLPEMIAMGEKWRFDDLKSCHELINRGLEKEEALLIQRRSDLASTNKLNNTLTLLIAIFAIAIITITFFSQFFLSRKSQWLEGFLESVLHTSQNGVLHCKSVRQQGGIVDFRLEFANKASSSLLGPDPDKLTGKKWNEIPALKNPELLAVCTSVVASGKPVEMEYADWQNGAERWFVLSVARMHDGITVAFYENTAIKNTEVELKKNITALEQSNKELEEYAYAASHDLQEPLRKIRTFSSFLQESQGVKSDAKAQEQLSKIKQSAERMTLLIRDLLAYSSLKQRDEFVATDLNEVVANVLEDFEVLITQTNAVITHDKLPEIKAIPVQMNQLFYNLINNSLKFSKKNLPLHLDLSCCLITTETVRDVPGLAGNTPYYEITVSDNGIGFNQLYAIQIFGLFKRLNDKNVYTGSGIGLALCKKVVLNHGGVIMANGKEGVGAQFYIYFPQSLAI